MDRCRGAVVIALERCYFPAGIKNRGGPKEKETRLTEIRLATPWNQIEAAMAQSRGHPLLVIVENGLSSEGLLERGYDWYVQWVKLETSALNTREFNGVLAGWKQKMLESPKKVRPSPADLSVAELIGSLKPAQLRSVIAALVALVVGAFALGALGARLIPVLGQL
jgi:hypothetical protein